MSSLNIPTLNTADGIVIPNEFEFGTWDGRPLTWRILRIDGCEALVITRDAFHPIAFHDQPRQANWAASNVRTWLNGEFVSAFAAEEQTAIVPQTLSTPDSEEFGTEGCEDTKDRLFCLSLSEANDLFATPATRSCAGDNPCWWLRSPGGLPEYAAYVHHDGWPNNFGYNVDETSVCVRPAMVLNLAAFDDIDASEDLILASDFGMEMMLECLETGDYTPMRTVVETLGMDESWASLVADTLEELAVDGDAQAMEELFDIFGDIEYGSGALAAALSAGQATVVRMLMRRKYSLDGKLHNPHMVNDTPGLKRDRKAAYHSGATSLAESAINGMGAQRAILLLIRQDSLPGHEYRLLIRAAARSKDNPDLFEYMLNPDHDEVPAMGARWSNRKVMVLAHGGKNDFAISQQAIRLLWHEGLAKEDPLSVKSMAPQLADPTIHDRQALLNCMIENGYTRELHELLQVKRMFTPNMLANGIQLAKDCKDKDIEEMLTTLLKSVGAGKLLQ